MKSKKRRNKKVEEVAGERNGNKKNSVDAEN